MALVGLRASYHKLLGRIELLLPAKLRPVYNHPAGKELSVCRGFSWFSLGIACLFADLFVVKPVVKQPQDV